MIKTTQFDNTQVTSTPLNGSNSRSNNKESKSKPLDVYVEMAQLTFFEETQFFNLKGKLISVCDSISTLISDILQKLGIISSKHATPVSVVRVEKPTNPKKEINDLKLDYSDALIQLNSIKNSDSEIQLEVIDKTYKAIYAIFEHEINAELSDYEDTLKTCSDLLFQIGKAEMGKIKDAYEHTLNNTTFDDLSPLTDLLEGIISSTVDKFTNQYNNASSKQVKKLSHDILSYLKNKKAKLEAIKEYRTVLKSEISKAANEASLAQFAKKYTATRLFSDFLKHGIASPQILNICVNEIYDQVKNQESHLSKEEIYAVISKAVADIEVVLS